MSILDHQRELAQGLQRASVLQRDVFVLETLVALFTRIEVDPLLVPFVARLAEGTAAPKDFNALNALLDVEECELGEEGFALFHALQWFIERTARSPGDVAAWCVDAIDERDQESDVETSETDLGPWAAAEVSAQRERLAKVLAAAEPSGLLAPARVELARLVDSSA